MWETWSTVLRRFFFSPFLERFRICLLGHPEKSQFVCAENQIVWLICQSHGSLNLSLDIGQRSDSLLLAVEHLPFLDKRLSRVNC